MNYEMRRQKVYEKMEEHSVLILFSGIESHVSADEYAPFEANRNFFLSDRPSQGTDDPRHGSVGRKEKNNALYSCI